MKVVLGGQISLGNFVLGDIIFRGTIKTVTPLTIIHMTVNIVTGSMLKGLREVGCRITTICKCKGYTPLLLNFDLEIERNDFNV